jgi:hypothetical protein
VWLSIPKDIDEALDFYGTGKQSTRTEFSNNQISNEIGNDDQGTFASPSKVAGIMMEEIEVSERGTDDSSSSQPTHFINQQRQQQYTDGSMSTAAATTTTSATSFSTSTSTSKSAANTIDDDISRPNLPLPLPLPLSPPHSQPVHAPWTETILAEGPDVMFEVFDLDAEDDCVEVVAAHFFGEKLSVHSIR